MNESTDKAALETELAELRAENERLRASLGVGRPSDAAESTPERSRPLRVLLLPEPAEREEGTEGPSAAGMTNLGRVLLEHQRKSRPDEEWIAEFDLARIPGDALCYRVGEVLHKVWDGSGPLPATFMVEEAAGGERRLQRQIVSGEPASERFREMNRLLLSQIADVVAEGEAAEHAGAHHHAFWCLKAADVMLARQRLGFVLFSGGDDGWREVLDEPRPEYEPRGQLAS